MSERIEITDARGTRIVPVDGDLLVLGSGEGCDVRLAQPGLQGRHLRFVRTDRGYRVEPVRAGATVAVNGEDLFCKDLEPGDRIELAGLQLRWQADAVVREAAASSRTGRERERDRDRVRQSARPARARSGGVAKWLPVAAVFALVLLAASALLRTWSRSTGPHSPQDYVDLARAQLGSDPQRALDTLAFALRTATGPVRDEALALERDIVAIQFEIAESPRISTARAEHDLLLSFQGRYLQDGSPRPAARELVRLCDTWLQRHEELCARHGDGLPLLRAVQELRSRYVAPAALGEPDTEADVMFAARSRLRFQWRDYRAALQMLDAWLAAHPAAAAVARERETMLVEGEEWLRGKLRIVDLLLDRGDTDNAARDLAWLEKRCALPPWQAMVQERRARLDGKH